jgi:hypothetical protein
MMPPYEPYEEKFKAYCYELIREHIESIHPSLVDSIYALSFYVDDTGYEYDGDEVEKLGEGATLTLTLGYNTTEQLEKCTPPNRGVWCMASDAGEAKWNYAFWLQNELCSIGKRGTESAKHRNKFVASILPEFDRTQEFVNLFVRISRQLHQQGIIQNKFGRDIPVIIHELEYYDQIAHQTSAANPNGIAEEFVEWFYFDSYGPS